MNKKIIGLLGETGSGKDTFSDYLKKKESSVDCFRFSQPLTDVLRIFLEDIKKEDQIWLSNNLRNRFGEDILAKAIAKKVKESEKEIVILNGIRVAEDFDLVKKIKGKVICITADTKKRWQRVKIRNEKKDDDVDFEKFLEMDQSRTEEQIKILGKKADFIIENEGSFSDFEKKIDKIIKTLTNG